MKFDELNKLLVKYYDIMDIPKSEKKKRVDCALGFYEVIWYILSLIRMELKNGKLAEIEFYIESLIYRLQDYLDSKNLPYEEKYIKDVSRDIIETTFRHLEDEDDYFLSTDRAVIIAQNETNTVYNYGDFLSAKGKGKKYKIWITENDDRVRADHVSVDGMKIPIDDFFEVGNDRMRYPHDFLNGSPENLINCRCICLYE